MPTPKWSAPLVMVLLLAAAATTSAVPEPIRAAMHFTPDDAITPRSAAGAGTTVIEDDERNELPADFANPIFTSDAGDARCSGGANGGTDPTGNECTAPGERY